jgi:3-deoxy-D-manno-octulosonate 8-phosphate phosphatase (KDO 8-P phosphatase)
LQQLQRKLDTEIQKIELLIFDVDGVMTDNRMIFINGGGEAKSFSAADGFAIKATSGGPLRFAVITARQSEITTRRCAELAITDVLVKWNKSDALDILTEKHGLALAQIGFIGNDIPDIPALERVGLAVCPADAEAEVVEYAHFRTERNGGHGCCREVISFILAAKGLNLVDLHRRMVANDRTR